MNDALSLSDSRGPDAMLKFTEISGHQRRREVILANTSHLCGTPDRPTIKICGKEKQGLQAATRSPPAPRKFHQAVWGPLCLAQDSHSLRHLPWGAVGPQPCVPLLVEVVCVFVPGIMQPGT